MTVYISNLSTQDMKAGDQKYRLHSEFNAILGYIRPCPWIASKVILTSGVSTITVEDRKHYLSTSTHSFLILEGPCVISDSLMGH